MISKKNSFEALETIKQLWVIMSSKRKKQLFLLMALMILVGLSDAISLGLLVPFLALMADPSKVVSSPALKFLLLWIEKGGSIFCANHSDVFNKEQNTLFLFMLLFSLCALFTGVLRIGLTWFGFRVAGNIGADIGQEVYKRTLYQPYALHISRNSSQLISGLTSKISLTIFSISNCLAFLTATTVIVCIFITLLFLDFKVTMALSLFLGACYLAITVSTNKRLASNSKNISTSHNQMIKLINEALGGIRNIILNENQAFYSRLYFDSDNLYRRANANASIISLTPRHIMETIGMITFAFLTFLLFQAHGGLMVAMPMLGALALGVQKMLPAMQQAFQAWSIVRTYQDSNQEILSFLRQPIPKWTRAPMPRPMLFLHDIYFDKVSFRYTETSPWIFKNLSLKIPHGVSVGFVGKTGSGKSTLLNLLMGLLSPTSGKILIDGKLQNQNNLRAWRQIISHVPQEIYLSDTSFAENIALGIPCKEIDMQRIREAARQAQIADFIESLAKNYNTSVGERGIRLSGGQRQRIGIARALYKKSPILILDEATNALDHKTESRILDAIYASNFKRTILIVSHHSAMLKNCSFLVDLNKGARKHIHNMKA